MCVRVRKKLEGRGSESETVYNPALMEIIVGQILYLGQFETYLTVAAAFHTQDNVILTVNITTKEATGVTTRSQLV